MNLKTLLYTAAALFAQAITDICPNTPTPSTPSNQCVQFSISSGTGCAWMCEYCANQLGTNNYFFPDNVCTYQSNIGCVGNPIAGKTYSCCSV